MREMDVRFEDSISILVRKKTSNFMNCIVFNSVLHTRIQVSSTVPEGKGVSSSASVEVATMSAVAAAHG